MSPLSPAPLSPTGLRIVPAISREARQDGAAYLAALRAGLTAEQADALVARMQAKRLEVRTSERMAERMERHAADVEQARAAERARVAAIEHAETISPKAKIWVDLPVK